MDGLLDLQKQPPPTPSAVRKHLTLAVTIVAAPRLTRAGTKRGHHPYAYCEVTDKPQTRKVTSVKDSNQPVWNEVFELNCMDNESLTFSVDDKAVPGGDELPAHGHAVLEVASVRAAAATVAGGFDGTMPLRERGTPTGQIRVKVCIVGELTEADHQGVGDVIADKIRVMFKASQLKEQSAQREIERSIPGFGPLGGPVHGPWLAWKLDGEAFAGLPDLLDVVWNKSRFGKQDGQNEPHANPDEVIEHACDTFGALTHWQPRWFHLGRA